MDLPESVTLPSEASNKIINDVCSLHGITRAKLLAARPRGYPPAGEEWIIVARVDAMQRIHLDRVPPMARSRIQILFNASESTVRDAVSAPRVRQHQMGEL